MADSDTPRMDRAQEILAQRQAIHGGIQAQQALALRAHKQVIDEQIAQQRFELQRQALELQRIKALTEIEKERAVVQSNLQKQQQTARAITALGSLDPNSADYTVNMAKVFNENPMASADPVIQDLVKSHIQTRKVVDETNLEIYKSQQAQQAILDREKAARNDADARAKAAEQKAVESGLPITSITAGTEYGKTTYGGTVSQKLDQGEKNQEAYRQAIISGQAKVGTSMDGKNFTPLTEGSTGGTHVSVTYQDPITGKPASDILPIEQYKSLKVSATTQDKPQEQSDQPAPIKLKYNMEKGELEDAQ